MTAGYINTTTPLFDLIEAERQAEAGIARAQLRRPNLTAEAKETAVMLGRRKGRVTADDVQRTLIEERGYGPHDLGNAAGSIFRDRTKWRFTGEYRKSTRVCGHGNLLRVWEYIGGKER